VTPVVPLLEKPLPPLEPEVKVTSATERFFLKRGAS
jgi:hypothetical protein